MMKPIEFLIELANKPFKSRDVNELIASQPEKTRDAFRANSSSMLKGTLDERQDYPNEGIVTQFNAS